MNKIDVLINDIIYDDLTTLEIKEKIESLLLDYGKYNAEKCLSDFKQTGSCIFDSSIVLNKFLTNN